MAPGDSKSGGKGKGNNVFSEKYMSYGAPGPGVSSDTNMLAVPPLAWKKNVKLRFESEPWGQLKLGCCKKLLFNQRLSEVLLIKHQRVFMEVSFRLNWLLSEGVFVICLFLATFNCEVLFMGESCMPPSSKYCFKSEIGNDSDCEFGPCVSGLPKESSLPSCFYC